MNSIKQGDIFLVNLNPIKGHEQGGLRPALILQNDQLNHNLSTVIIAPITSNMALKGLMTTHFLPAKSSGLNRDSLVLVYQVRTIDKGRFIKRIARISKNDFFEIHMNLMRMLL
jgi:mRNA interferase MazF